MRKTEGVYRRIMREKYIFGTKYVPLVLYLALVIHVKDPLAAHSHLPGGATLLLAELPLRPFVTEDLHLAVGPDHQHHVVNGRSHHLSLYKNYNIPVTYIVF